VPPPPASKPELPAVPGYEIEGGLGKGGMAVVYRGRDPKFKRVVAIKVLRKEYRGDAEMTARFLEEAQITGQLQNPGIPPVYDVGTLADGLPFFTIKLVQGHTLWEMLGQRKSPADDLPRFLELFGQVCQTLAYAHSHHVIHRDLKPQNVMVGKFGEVQVMDWGMAKVLGQAKTDAGSAESVGRLHAVRSEDRKQASEQGDLWGTPAFMPPEQARGEIDQLDERSDVFGLGAILCVIQTGQPPYTPAKGDVLRQARQGQLGDAEARLNVSKADGELIALARACLAADKEGRPDDAAIAGQAVVAYQAGVQDRLRSAELERTASQVKAAEERKRRKVVARFLSAIIASVVVGAGVATYFAFDANESASKARKKEGEVTTANTELNKTIGHLQESEDNLEGTVARSWLLPLSPQPIGPLSNLEVEVLSAAAAKRNERLTIRFVDEALKEPRFTSRLAARAEFAMHAAVGLDSAKREEVERLILAQLQAPDASEESQQDAALALAALGDLSPAATAAAAQTLTRALSTNENSIVQPLLAESLTSLAPRLSAKDARSTAAIITDALLGKKRFDFRLLPMLASTLRSRAELSASEPRTK
jgi:serine/threonine protein kinase